MSGVTPDEKGKESLLSALHRVTRSLYELSEGVNMFEEMVSESRCELGRRLLVAQEAHRKLLDYVTAKRIPDAAYLPRPGLDGCCLGPKSGQVHEGAQPASPTREAEGPR